MRLYHITVIARSPLAFPERKPGTQFRRSLGYIPGAAIYGALGLRLGGQKRLPSEAFHSLFESLRCHNAYPAWPEDEWSRPLPASAERPKGEDEIPPRDTLVDRVCWELLQPPALIFSPTDGEGRPWEAVRGFHARPLPKEEDLHQQTLRSVPQRVLTRVSINRRRGTAEDQLLYSPLVLSEVSVRRRYVWDRTHTPAREQPVKEEFPTRFLGSIGVPDEYDLADDLLAITRVGGRTTTGLGSVEVQLREPPTTELSVQQRIEALTRRFRTGAERYRSLGGSGWEPEGEIFTVDLLSDAILYEHGWHPTMVLTAAMLRQAAQIEADLKLLRSFASYGYIGGWHVNWDRPKPGEVGTLMGSVFVFQAPQGLHPADYERLAELQRTGIGERRAEGYGQVRICDEFHLTAPEEMQ